MIVEPEPDLRVLAAQAVQELGHEALPNEGGRCPDVLLAATSDDALAYARALRARHPRLPIVFMGTREPSEATHAFATAVRIVKPYGLRDLGRAISRALALSDPS